MLHLGCALAWPLNDAAVRCSEHAGGKHSCLRFMQFLCHKHNSAPWPRLSTAESSPPSLPPCGCCRPGGEADADTAGTVEPDGSDAQPPAPRPQCSGVAPCNRREGRLPWDVTCYLWGSSTVPLTQHSGCRPAAAAGCAVGAPRHTCRHAARPGGLRAVCMMASGILYQAGQQPQHSVQPLLCSSAAHFCNGSPLCQSSLLSI